MFSTLPPADARRVPILAAQRKVCGISTVERLRKIAKRCRYLAKYAIKFERGVNTLSLIGLARLVNSVAIDSTVVEPDTGDSRVVLDAITIVVADDARRDKHARQRRRLTKERLEV